MHRLVYFSSAVQLFDDEDLIKILSKARKFNEDNDITGMLLYAKGNFMQILEGEKTAVQATFGRIEKDERHHDIRVIFNNSAPKRLFEGWRMGFKMLTEDELSKISGFEPLGSREESKNNFSQDDLFVAMMKKFYEANMGLTL